MSKLKCSKTDYTDLGQRIKIDTNHFKARAFQYTSASFSIFSKRV